MGEELKARNEFGELLDASELWPGRSVADEQPGAGPGTEGLRRKGRFKNPGLEWLKELQFCD